jgi:hypothetical protein
VDPVNSKPEFVPYPKIARFSREVIVTEKIDGTNAQILITPEGEVHTGSRNQWSDDHFGFALWVERNKTELLKLGPGRHFGEWWGSGIQRGYGLQNGEKRFSLFNVDRWHNDVLRPACCSVVPILWRGLFDDLPLGAILGDLRRKGSYASPGFMRPEGIIIYHVAANLGFKKTLEKDEEPKGKNR